MSDEIRAFLLNFSFFSRINLYKGTDFQRLLPKSIKYIPLFSLISGTALFFCFKIFSLIIKEDIAVVLTLVIQYIIFNFFHFDGFLDTTDAFLSGKTKKEEILKIMEDTHTGAFAVLFGSIYIFLKLFLYINLVTDYPELLIFSFSLGRICMVIFPSVFNRSAKDYGLGYTFISNVKKGFLTSAILLLIISSVYFYQTILTLIVVFLFSIYFIKKVGGFTGDILGFICEISELLWLLTLYSWK